MTLQTVHIGAVVAAIGWGLCANPSGVVGLWRQRHLDGDDAG